MITPGYIILESGKNELLLIEVSRALKHSGCKNWEFTGGPSGFAPSHASTLPRSRPVPVGRLRFCTLTTQSFFTFRRKNSETPLHPSTPLVTRRFRSSRALLHPVLSLVLIGILYFSPKADGFLVHPGCNKSPRSTLLHSGTPARFCTQGAIQTSQTPSDRVARSLMVPFLHPGCQGYKISWSPGPHFCPEGKFINVTSLEDKYLMENTIMSRYDVTNLNLLYEAQLNRRTGRGAFTIRRAILNPDAIAFITGPDSTFKGDLYPMGILKKVHPAAQEYKDYVEYEIEVDGQIDFQGYESGKFGYRGSMYGGADMIESKAADDVIILDPGTQGESPGKFVVRAGDDVDLTDREENDFGDTATVEHSNTSTLPRLNEVSQNAEDDGKYIDSLFNNLKVVKVEKGQGHAQIFVNGDIFVPPSILRDDTGDPLRDAASHLQAELKEYETLPAFESALRQIDITPEGEDQATYRVTQIEPREQNVFNVTIQGAFTNPVGLPDPEHDISLGMPETI